jgi:SAM-dependent methyltransferase
VPRVSKEKGLYSVICEGTRYLSFDSLWAYYLRIFKPRTFAFEGHTYSYFFHKYNRTWANERAIEIPIVCEMMKEYRGKRILEAGNVLSHYFQVDHDIVDKYERADGVINQDIVDFRPPRKYDLIVSISTLEHVGVNEKQTPTEPRKALRAIESLKSLLVPGGKMIITLPIGYTVELDELLRERKIEFTRRYCLKRISMDNKWVEMDWNDIQNTKYSFPFPAANGLIIGLIEKQTDGEYMTGALDCRRNQA